MIDVPTSLINVKRQVEEIIDYNYSEYYKPMWRPIYLPNGRYYTLKYTIGKMESLDNIQVESMDRKTEHTISITYLDRLFIQHNLLSNIKTLKNMEYENIILRIYVCSVPYNESSEYLENHLAPFIGVYALSISHKNKYSEETFISEDVINKLVFGNAVNLVKLSNSKPKVCITDYVGEEMLHSSIVTGLNPFAYMNQNVDMRLDETKLFNVLYAPTSNNLLSNNIENYIILKRISNE